MHVLAGRKEIISTGLDGRKALQVVLAAMRSWRENRPVTL
jgi:hypothetical protein